MTVVDQQDGRRLQGAVIALLGLAMSGHCYPAPLETYARLPSVEDVAIAPDGSRLAYVRTEGDDRIIAIVSLPAREPLGAFSVGAEKLRTIQWADNTRLLISTSRLYSAEVLRSSSCISGGGSGSGAPAADGTGPVRGSAAGSSIGSIMCTARNLPVTREWSLLQVYDVSNHSLTPIPEPTRVAGLTLMNVTAGAPMVRYVNGHTEVVVPAIFLNSSQGIGTTDDDSKALLPALIRVDLDSGNEQVLRRGTSETGQWFADAAGNAVVELDYVNAAARSNRRWRLKTLRDERIGEAVSGGEGSGYARLAGFGPTANTILVETPDSDDAMWKLLSLKDGFLRPMAVEGGPWRDPIAQPMTNRLIGGVRIQDESLYAFFDPVTQSHWDSIVHNYDGARVQLVSFSEDFSKIAVRVEGAKIGYKYELVDVATGKHFQIGDIYQGVTTPLEVRRISYAAADGLSIQAYLTLPARKDPKGLALIVLPHEMASGVDTTDFDWWSQALSDQGYAVLRANFRGSALNRAFMTAGAGEWGRKMQSDLADGVRYLTQQGIADPKRVCIVGAGYGGYAALAAVSLDPGVYRCAVAVDGISDLGRWQKWAQGNALRQASGEQRDWDRLMGAGAHKGSALDDLSPIRHVDAVRAPVMLIHGQYEVAVPFEQSQAMYDALRHAGKPVELVMLPQEDDLISTAGSRLLMLQKSVEFLRSNNPPD
jgi:dipeptidyl aminopeptidase/acylaminoacyl peptidase